MKSSTGKYYVGLDHLRAVAAYMVFAWHFIHIDNGNHKHTPLFPLSLLTEGHTGVALFMTLSGYLFAKLLGDKQINFPSFLWNRFLRLAPLLILVVIIVGFKVYFSGGNFPLYLELISWGFLHPILPNGGWSITVEFHFYLLLPLLLFLRRKSVYFLIAILCCMIVFRLFLYLWLGDVQSYAYLTIIGRLDQFLLGILAWHYRSVFIGRHLLTFLMLSGLAAFYFYFDYLGGYYKSSGNTSIANLWIFLTTLEGAAYATLIAWYDNSFEHFNGKISQFIALIGTYSYSIYLLHYFFVFALAELIDKHVVGLSNIYVALALSPIAFLLMMPLGWASYKYIESPFLKFRTKYIRGETQSNITKP